VKRRLRDLEALGDPALAPVRDALTAPAAPDELAGEDQALAMFNARSWGRRSRPAFWRPAVLSTVIATKLGAAAAAGAVTLSGAAAVAYTGNLPAGLQDVAHRTIKAPPAHAKGPDATGPAAYGLCQAFAKDKDKNKDKDKDKEDKGAEKSAEPKGKPTEAPAPKPGKGLGRDKVNGNGNGKADDAGPGASKKGSVAYRNLVRAAGGEDKVEAYCATVPKPSGEPDASEDQGKPDEAKPTKAPAHSTGKPSSGADGQRSTPSPTATPSAEESAEPTPTETSEPTPTATG
jgi:hypothetical protein